ncbi:MAG: hypothetical protein ACRECT_02245 [Thermoplasmata archaeon]
MAPENGPPNEESLLAELRHAVAEAPGRPREIEVGIALSIALGRRRPSVSCGGCKNPLDFEGIPARTNARLGVPFRLIFEGPTDS